MRLLFFSLLILFVLPLHAFEEVNIALPSGDEISVETNSAEGRTLLLWLPSEEGLGSAHTAIAEGLADLGIDVWVPRLHQGLMLTPGRLSLDEVNTDDLLVLLDRAARLGFERIFILSYSRGAGLVLKMTYRWQQQNPQQAHRLAGLLLFSPHLLQDRVVIGEQAGYLPITDYSNLPIYLIMPEYSTKYARSSEIAVQLQRGGSPVFTHLMRGIRGGFQQREDEDLKPVDIEMRRRLPQLLKQAMELLSRYRPAQLKAGWRPVGEKVESSFRAPSLYPIKGFPEPPPLRLKTLDGRDVNLEELKGEVVLVNFWATWCAPCIEEIPSLTRLVRRLQGKPFRVLAVNIGEQPEAIRRFLARIPVNFDVLLDSDSRAVRDWKVYAYPSNYIIDRQGRLHFGYRGALAWDAPNIVETIESLL